MNRRQFLLGLSAAGASTMLYGGVRFWPEDGLKNPCFTGLPVALQQHPLMKKIWADIEADQVWDCHTHVIGAGDDNSGAWFTPKMDSLQHPILKTQKHFYMNGACLTEGNEDTIFVQRITHLASEMPKGYKSMLFAFDWVHNDNGKPNPAQSIFHIPNAYAAKIAKDFPQYFEWVASIHPYRPDAIDALEEAYQQGARAIKWLPSGMNINPASKKCVRFYQKLEALNLPIIVHTGRELAVQGGEQSYGNPLHLRLAMDQGVRVVMAHCASDGEDEDLDNQRKPVRSFDLFTRLMDAPATQKFCYGEISATILFNHAWVLKPLLSREDWHARLLNGTDYPLPGIMPLISTKNLAENGLLKTSDLDFLKLLRRYNPLMFDFAVKRLIQFDGKSFAPEVFHTRHFFMHS
jgi:mannonate dehydratase